MPLILVIDDSHSTLESVSLMLAKAGHLARTCSSGARALQLVRHERYDLVLTDILMPDEDGLQVIQGVRRLRPELPIVAMSGMTGAPNMLRMARHLGARQVLRKPFSSTELLMAVDAALAPAAARPGGHRETAEPQSDKRADPE